MNISNYKSSEHIDIYIQVKEINKVYSAFYATVSRSNNEKETTEYIEGIQKNNYLSNCLKKTIIPTPLQAFYKSEELLCYYKKLGFELLFSPQYSNQNIKILERVNFLLNLNKVTFDSVKEDTIENIIIIDDDYLQLQNIMTNYIYNSAVDMKILGIHDYNFHNMEEITENFIKSGRIFNSELHKLNFSDDEYSLILKELTKIHNPVLNVKHCDLSNIIVENNLLGINKYLK